MTLGSLRDLDLELTYESGYHNLVTDFYVPCLQCAVLYERSVGYFTSSGLSAAAKGIAHLLNNDGEIRLIASPKLNENDIAAMRDGLRDRQDVIKDAVRTSFCDIENELVNNRLSALAWLISIGKLKVKLALPTNNDSGSQGFYHKKRGIITDGNGDYVAFAGSANETTGRPKADHSQSTRSSTAFSNAISTNSMLRAPEAWSLAPSAATAVLPRIALPLRSSAM